MCVLIFSVGPALHSTKKCLWTSLQLRSKPSRSLPTSSGYIRYAQSEGTFVWYMCLLCMAVRWIYTWPRI